MAPVVMAVAAVAGVGLQIYGGIRQAQAQRKQNRLQEKQNRLRANAERKKILLEARRRRAEFLSQLGASGAGFGSSAASGAGQIDNAASNSLVSVNQQTALGSQQRAAQDSESTGAMVSSVGGGVISGAQSATSIASSGADFRSLFNL